MTNSNTLTQNDIRLETQRLIIREYQESDWQDCLAYGQDPDVVRFMVWGPNGPEQTKNFIAKTFTDREASPRVNFELAAFHKDDKKVIGGIGLRISSLAHKHGDIGYCFAKNYWGQNFGTEAAKAMIDLAFTKLDLHRVEAFCDTENIGSARIMEKAGMQKEGLLRHYNFIKGQWRDSLIYSILIDEWQKQKA